jgi:hypothetical protein
VPGARWGICVGRWQAAKRGKRCCALGSGGAGQRHIACAYGGVAKRGDHPANADKHWRDAEDRKRRAKPGADSLQSIRMLAVPAKVPAPADQCISGTSACTVKLVEHLQRSLGISTGRTRLEARPGGSAHGTNVDRQYYNCQAILST